MHMPFISITVSILYFAWQWHDRSARGPSKRGASNRPAIKPNRVGESRALELAPISRVTVKPFKLKNISTPVAEGAAQ